MKDHAPYINPLNAELNPIWNLLALLGAHPILHVSKIRVNNRSIRGSQSILLQLYYEKQWSCMWVCVDIGYIFQSI